MDGMKYQTLSSIQILAIIVVKRTLEIIKSEIDITQAAYRPTYTPGRSTTELVFTFRTSGKLGRLNNSSSPSSSGSWLSHI